MTWLLQGLSSFVKVVWSSRSINDVVTFGCLALAFWFNHDFLGGNRWFSALIAICFFVSVFSSGGKKARTFGSYREAITHLQELERGRDA